MKLTPPKQITFWIAVLLALVGLLIFVGCFFALTEAKQAIHDKLVKTAVFRKSDLPA